MNLFLFVLSFLLLNSALAQSPNCTVEVELTGVIGPASVDLLGRVERYAAQEKCSSVLLLINTPGGSLESTRRMVETILSSPHAFLCLVSPSGGHAGSAGAILLQACHVNGALSGTNLGAATPVAMGQDLPKDLREKILNDTRSWLESLTRLRGRSDKFGQDIIMSAKAVTAEDALKLKAIDFVGQNKIEFVKFSEGRSVKMSESKIESVRTGELKPFIHDTRHKLLSLVTDPELAYMLLLGSLALLYFEITHPGTMIAGVVGALGLVIALVALHKLDVEWGGLLLIFLGIAMLVAEIFLPSFGIVGVGGLVAFVLGSIFLFDPVKSWGYQLPWTLIAPVVIFFALLFVGVSLLLLRTARVKKKGGFDELVGSLARVVRVGSAKEGLISMVEVQGELWKVESVEPLNMDDVVRIKSHKGLILIVQKESST